MMRNVVIAVTGSIVAMLLWLCLFGVISSNSIVLYPLVSFAAYLNMYHPFYAWLVPVPVGFLTSCIVDSVLKTCLGAAKYEDNILHKELVAKGVIDRSEVNKRIHFPAPADKWSGDEDNEDNEEKCNNSEDSSGGTVKLKRGKTYIIPKGDRYTITPNKDGINTIKLQKTPKNGGRAVGGV